MNFAEIITRLAADTEKSLPLFSPELAIVVTIVLLLLVRLFDADKRFPGSIVAILGTVVALGLAACRHAPPVQRPYAAPTSDELAQLLDARAATVKSLNARARATSWLGGERVRATVLIDSPYDPENKDLRA